MSYLKEVNDDEYVEEKLPKLTLMQRFLNSPIVNYLPTIFIKKFYPEEYTRMVKTYLTTNIYVSWTTAKSIVERQRSLKKVKQVFVEKKPVVVDDRTLVFLKEAEEMNAKKGNFKVRVKVTDEERDAIMKQKTSDAFGKSMVDIRDGSIEKWNENRDMIIKAVTNIDHSEKIHNFVEDSKFKGDFRNIVVEEAVRTLQKKSSLRES